MEPELGAFLRFKRESIDPLAAGFPAGRRRTPGLRREEVAQLAGVSVTWYTWLEQSRDIGVSRQVLDSVARALRMNPGERRHLFALAGLVAPTPPTGPVPVDPAVRKLLDTLEPNPAYVANPWWDILAYNAGYAALAPILDEIPPEERNSLWLIFTDEHVRRSVADEPAESDRMVGQLRANLARYPDDPRGQELVAALLAASPRFAKRWSDDHSVREFHPARKTFLVPGAGRLEFDYVKLSTAGTEMQDVLVFMPADEATASGLRQLLSGRLLN
jgi:transcriptional regulator with XRE-family HTH domain